LKSNPDYNNSIRKETDMVFNPGGEFSLNAFSVNDMIFKFVILHYVQVTLKLPGAGKLSHKI
jgi:hypothetical protein